MQFYYRNSDGSMFLAGRKGYTVSTRFRREPSNYVITDGFVNWVAGIENPVTHLKAMLILGIVPYEQMISVLNANEGVK